MAAGEPDLDKVSRWWNRPAEERRQRAQVVWMEHEHVRRYINRRTTGDDSLDWLSYVLAKFFPTPVERGLSLGCADGALERHALGAGAVERFDAYDASDGAIRSARANAERDGLAPRVCYAVTDLNLFTSPGRVYDAAFASMSMHHIEALERLYDEVSRSLTPNGLFVMNEYIGPTRFQLAPSQLKIINDLLATLPPRYRRVIQNGQPTDELKTQHRLHPMEWFERYDPSEAVRSADLLPVMKRYFEIVELRPYGGAVLHFLLENIVGNFDDSREEDRAWLGMLEHFEATLEDGGLVGSDFALVVARPLER